MRHEILENIKSLPYYEQVLLFISLGNEIDDGRLDSGELKKLLTIEAVQDVQRAVAAMN